jgi:inner membrane protein
LVLAANAPDIDVLSAFFGSDASLGFRRGWTHGPLAILVLPVLVTVLVLAWDRSRRRRRPELAPPDARRLLALAYLGCLTHPLLDWLNTYGVRLLMPFDERWFYGDALFIVDPWLWLVLGGALYLGSRRDRLPWGWMILGAATTLVVLRAGSLVPLASRVAWVIGLAAIVVLRRATSRPRPSALASAALGLSVAYVGAMLALTTTGSIRVRHELARRGPERVERLMVAPRPANPFGWDAVADLGDRYVRGTLRWLPRPEVAIDPTPTLKPRPSPILDAARAAPEIQGALRWMRFPYAQIEETGSGWTVWFLDARYVRIRSRGFGAAVVRIPRDTTVP